MRFLTAYYNKTKGTYLLKIDNGGNPKGDWATTTKAVYTFAKNNFKEGEECNCEQEEQNGQVHITRITKIGEPVSTHKETPKASSKSAEYTCEDCGVTLKDGKYKKCYNCNQKKTKETPPPSTSGTLRMPSEYSRPQVPEAVERMTKLSLMSSASQAVSALVGQLTNVDAVTEATIAIYRRLVDEITK